LAELQANLEGLEKEIETVTRQISQNGGQRMDIIKQEIQQDENLLQMRQGNFRQYEKQAQQLSLVVPQSAVEFQKNTEQLAEKKRTELQLKDELAEELSSYDLNSKDIEKEIARTRSELESLRQRKSSIPREYVEIRDELCRDLDLAEAEMPFAGELMEVKPSESEWEGAIERLLRGFGMSLLVPEVHYAEVADWMERKTLRLHLVYYRVNDYIDTAPLAEVDEASACGKINLRQDSSFWKWLQRELQQRFRYTCCETMQQFRREAYALTMGGQVKRKGQRHEKDDRYKLNDRRQYVLGFSNHKKIQALEMEMEDANLESKRWKKLIKEIKVKQDGNSRRLAAIDVLADMEDFSAIELSSLQDKLAQKRQQVLVLAKENDALRLLQERAEKLRQSRAAAADQLAVVRDNITRTKTFLSQNRERLASNAEVVGQIDEKLREMVYPRLEENWHAVLGEGEVAETKLAEQENRYALWLAKEIDGNQEKLSHKGTILTNKMMEYIQKYPQETNLLDASPEALPEYKAVLQKLEMDGLPKFETKFKELLRENTIHQIALFQGKLAMACDIIRERIDMINHSLGSIDYNEGRYIAIEYTETAHREIKDFRLQLKACTDSILTGADDDPYSEARFLQVKAIVERFQGRPGFTDIDEQWRKKVIDVRNWYEFAASERWRETGEEYEHYTDSGGKSGGQKEKLAYTILAASLVYNFGLEAKNKRIESFRFVVIDEAFLKSSDDSARFGLELFKKLKLQLLVVTPLLKIATIEPFVTHVGFVYQNDEKHTSFLRNLSMQELQEERRAQS